MKTKSSLFWVVTGLFALALGSSGFGYLAGAAQYKEGLAHLGYPDYLRYFLGVAKVLGALALVVPLPKQLKEWAYAGFTFNLLGAAYSHGMSGDNANFVIIPLVLLGLLAVSYFTYHSIQKTNNA